MPIWLANFFTKEYWAFNGSDLVQLFLGIIGFVIAYLQIMKTKNSVESAREATKDTQNAIKERFAIIDSTEVVNGIRLLKDSINSQKYDKARWILDETSIRMIQLSKRAEFVDTEDKKTKISNTIKFLANLESILIDSEENPDKLDLKNVNIRLSEIMRDIYGWAEKRKFSTGAIDDE